MINIILILESRVSYNLPKRKEEKLEVIEIDRKIKDFNFEKKLSLKKFILKKNILFFEEKIDLKNVEFF